MAASSGEIGISEWRKRISAIGNGGGGSALMRRRKGVKAACSQQRGEAAANMTAAENVGGDEIWRSG
jgi:hypothetical protein